MKLRTVLILGATILSSHGHDAPAPGASVPKRFAIVANGKDGVFRIDTATGKTWLLEKVGGGVDGAVDGWVPVVETVRDEKIGGYKPALLKDSAGTSAPQR